MVAALVIGILVLLYVFEITDVNTVWLLEFINPMRLLEFDLLIAF